MLETTRTATRILVLCLLAAGCGKPESSSTGTTAAPKPPGGEVKLGEASRAFLAIEAIQPTDAALPRAYFGRTAFRPKALSAITAQFAGRVASVAVEPGQRVSAGATLFRVQSADALAVRSALEQARLRARLAEEVLNRQAEMVKRGVGLEIERFDAEMKLREARAELERSERNAALLGAGEGALLNVRAPVDGVIVSVKVAVGATLQPGGDALVEIGNPRALWVVADVPEGEVEQAAKASKIEVTISALDNLAVAGRVAGVAPRSDPETRRTPIYIELERVPSGLRAGLLVRVAMAQRAGSGELWLPVSAVLLKQGGRRIVYVESKDSSLVAREIETGDERAGQVRVLKGLQAGDRVVMRGALLVDREAEQLL